MEKAEAAAAKKAAAAAKKVSALEAKKPKAMEAAQSKATRAGWVVEEKSMCWLLWPAKGEEAHPERLLLLSKLVLVQTCIRDPGAAKEARQNRIQAWRERRLQEQQNLCTAADDGTADSIGVGGSSMAQKHVSQLA